MDLVVTRMSYRTSRDGWSPRALMPRSRGGLRWGVEGEQGAKTQLLHGRSGRCDSCCDSARPGAEARCPRTLAQHQSRPDSSRQAEELTSGLGSGEPKAEALIAEWRPAAGTLREVWLSRPVLQRRPRLWALFPPMWLPAGMALGTALGSGKGEARVPVPTR